MSAIVHFTGRVSAASDGNHDFYRVAFLDSSAGVLAFGHDIAVQFHGNAFVLVAQLDNQRANRVGVFQSLALAIQGNVHSCLWIWSGPRRTSDSDGKFLG